MAPTSSELGPAVNGNRPDTDFDLAKRSKQDEVNKIKALKSFDDKFTDSSGANNTVH